MRTTTTVHVSGMSCGHCVAAVTEEVSKIGGVTQVSVDLDSGDVEITSGAPVDPSAVAAAVEEAGYEMTS